MFLKHMGCIPILAFMCFRFCHIHTFWKCLRISGPLCFSVTWLKLFNHLNTLCVQLVRVCIFIHKILQCGFCDIHPKPPTLESPSPTQPKLFCQPCYIWKVRMNRIIVIIYWPVIFKGHIVYMWVM